VIGTSAGAAVAGQLATGLPLGELFDRQVDPARQATELSPLGVSFADLMRRMEALASRTPDPGGLRRRIGELALGADTVAEPARRRVIEQRLPGRDWPSWPLRVVAVDAHSGEPVVFERGLGVELVDAIAASCAGPGV